MKHFPTISLAAVLCLVTPVIGFAQQAPSLPPINNPPTELSLPGKFIWFDLATPALAEQKAFYADVFGWSYRSPGTAGDGYVLVLNGDQPIAGMFEADPPGGEQDGATWISLFSVADVDSAVKTAQANGGHIEVPPANIPGRGRHALVRDPTDALFGMLHSASGDPADDQVPIGGILWVDLFTRNVDTAAEFYLSLAPWKVSHRAVVEGGDGRLLSAEDQPRAGIVPVDEEANRSAWVPYVRVADVVATLQRAVEGGGFVIIDPDQELFDGNLGIFVDPNGGVMGVVKYEYEDAP